MLQIAKSISGIIDCVSDEMLDDEGAHWLLCWLFSDIDGSCLYIEDLDHASEYRELILEDHIGQFHQLWCRLGSYLGRFRLFLRLKLLADGA